MIFLIDFNSFNIFWIVLFGGRDFYKASRTLNESLKIVMLFEVIVLANKIASYMF